MSRGCGWMMVLLAGVAFAGVPGWAQDETPMPAVLLLDATAKTGALHLDGENTLTVRKGDLVVNSTHNSALFSANSKIEVPAGAIRLAGGYNNLGESSITPTPVTGAAAVADPLTGVQYPKAGDVRSRQKLYVPDGRETTLKPGYYAGGINAYGRNTVLRLEPGMYVITDGDFFIGAGEVSGEGVTVIMSGKQPGKLSFGAGARGKLVAPREGPLKDMLIVSAAKTQGNTSDIGFNDARVVLQGLIYAPKGRLGLLAEAQVIVGRVVAYNLLMNTGATLEVLGAPVTDPAWESVEIPAAPER